MNQVNVSVTKQGTVSKVSVIRKTTKGSEEYAAVWFRPTDSTDGTIEKLQRLAKFADDAAHEEDY